MKKKFSEVLEIKNGKNQKSVEVINGAYPIYGSGGEMGRASNYICEAETIIIGRKGTINNPLFVNEPFWNVDTAFGLCANRKVLFPKYLYHFCKSFDFNTLSTTVTIPSLTKTNLLSIELPLPSLPEQQKIAAHLDSIQSAIDNKKQQLQQLDELVKSKFVEMFGENPVESGKWKVETLGDIGKISMCKRVLREQTTPEGDIPFYKIGTFGKQADAYISRELFENFKSKYAYPKKGSILISASGTIGRSVVFDGEPAYFQDSNIVWIDNDESKVLNGFLLYWYGTSPWKVTQGGTISRLYNSNITEANVIIPPLEIQNEFITFVQKIDTAKSIIKTQLADLQELLDSKMDEYFGE